MHHRLLLGLIVLISVPLLHAMDDYYEQVIFREQLTPWSLEQQNRTQAIFDAIDNNDIAAFTSLIKTTNDANTMLVQGEMIHLFAITSNEKLYERYFEASMWYNGQRIDEDGWKPIGIKRKHEETFRKIIDPKTITAHFKEWLDKQPRSEQSGNEIKEEWDNRHRAYRKQHEAIIQAHMKEPSYAIYIQNFYTPLHTICQELGSTDLSEEPAKKAFLNAALDHLLELRVDVAQPDYHGNTPLSLLMKSYNDDYWGRPRDNLALKNMQPDGTELNEELSRLPTILAIFKAYGASFNDVLTNFLSCYEPQKIPKTFSFIVTSVRADNMSLDDCSRHIATYLERQKTIKQQQFHLLFCACLANRQFAESTNGYQNVIDLTINTIRYRKDRLDEGDTKNTLRELIDRLKSWQRIAPVIFSPPHTFPPSSRIQLLPREIIKPLLHYAYYATSKGPIPPISLESIIPSCVIL